MEARAVARHVRISPRKTRQVADCIRGKKVTEAYHILELLKKRASQPISKTIQSAVANALDMEGAAHVIVENLHVKSIYVDEGPTLRRFRARAMGRATRIRKRTCHITVIVAEDESSQ
ncbi:MAG: 50S ribosomal protein L22 [Candidatus Cloacimonetes bacterium 4572_55]|nr:MAG: 50S ribosomal protein L22 [Candidatus Cloacimonetes bacterium 4572_55]